MQSYLCANQIRLVETTVPRQWYKPALVVRPYKHQYQGCRTTYPPSCHQMSLSFPTSWRKLPSLQGQSIPVSVLSPSPGSSILRPPRFFLSRCFFLSVNKCGRIAVLRYNILLAIRLTVDIPQEVDAVCVMVTPVKVPRQAAFVLCSLMYSPCNAARKRLLQHLNYTFDEVKAIYPSY